MAKGRVVATAPRPYSRCQEPGWMVNPRACPFGRQVRSPGRSVVAVRSSDSRS